MFNLFFASALQFVFATKSSASISFALCVCGIIIMPIYMDPNADGYTKQAWYITGIYITRKRILHKVVITSNVVFMIIMQGRHSSMK